ncbi:MAG: hypothetical protein V2B18_04620 [Pseudomonadota bacterium]
MHPFVISFGAGVTVYVTVNHFAPFLWQAALAAKDYCDSHPYPNWQDLPAVPPDFPVLPPPEPGDPPLDPEDSGIRVYPDRPWWQGWPDRVRGLFDGAFAAIIPPPRPDPLALDLDGDGIETTDVSAGAYFDHEGDGFAEATGWVAADDGLLVLDRNGDGMINDGRELFGDQTILKDGTIAANGYQALAEWDDNQDGKIDSNDAVFAQLRVWQDEDGDGYSRPEELHTFTELGITAVNLDSTVANATDSQGNTQTRVGSFEDGDATSEQMGEYVFQRDTTYTIPNDWMDVPEDIEALPELWGSGNVYDLHQAIVRDGSGRLRSAVEQFVAADDPAVRGALTEQILFLWADVDEVDPHSRGGAVDGRQLALLEKTFGRSFVGANGPNPNYCVPAGSGSI